MGPLAERVGGADEAVGYLSLLAALYFLRMTRPAGWRRVEEYPTSGEGLRSSGALLRLIGSEADAALYTSGSLPDMQEACPASSPGGSRTSWRSSDWWPASALTPSN